MNNNETAIRGIKDRVAAALGELDEASVGPEKKGHYKTLVNAAAELHKCADDLQNIMMRIRPRGS